VFGISTIFIGGREWHDRGQTAKGETALVSSSHGIAAGKREARVYREIVIIIRGSEFPRGKEGKSAHRKGEKREEGKGTKVKVPRRGDLRLNASEGSRPEGPRK